MSELYADVARFSSYKTVCHVNSFSDQMSYSFYMNCHDIQDYVTTITTTTTIVTVIIHWRFHKYELPYNKFVTCHPTVRILYLCPLFPIFFKLSSLLVSISCAWFVKQLLIREIRLCTLG